MPFEETVAKAPGSAQRPDVTATITGPKQDRLRLVLAFSPEGASRLGITIGSRWRVLVGTGPDAGRLRLRADDSANCQVVRVGKTGIVLGCGYHPSFTVPRSKEACRQVSRDFRTDNIREVDILLPDPWPRNDWSKPMARAAASRTTAVAQPSGSAPSAAAPSPPAAAPAAKSAAPVTRPTRVEHCGVTVDFTKGAESVAYGGKSATLTGQEALLVGALAERFGKAVSAAVLTEAVWVGRSVREAARDLERLIDETNARLRLVGLAAFNGGFGWVLMQAQAKRGRASSAA